MELTDNRYVKREKQSAFEQFERTSHSSGCCSYEDSSAKTSTPFKTECNIVKWSDKENSHGKDTFVYDKCKRNMISGSPTGDIASRENVNECDSNNGGSKMGKQAKNESSTKPEKLICPHCSKVMKNNCTFLKHKDYCLRKITWTKKCSFCEKMFRDNYGLKRHLKVHGIHLTSKVFECKYCHKHFRDNYNMSKHMDTVHKIEEVDQSHFNSKVHFQCTHCSAYFKDKISLRRHIKIAHSSPVHRCPICKKKFSGLKTLNSHLCTHHSESCPKSKEHFCVCDESPTDRHQNGISSDDDACCPKCHGKVQTDNRCLQSKVEDLLNCASCEIVLPRKKDRKEKLDGEHNIDKSIPKSEQDQLNESSFIDDQCLCIFCIYCSSRESDSSKQPVKLSFSEAGGSCPECGTVFQSEKQFAVHCATDHEKLIHTLCDRHRFQIDQIKTHRIDTLNPCQKMGSDNSMDGDTFYSLQPIEHTSEMVDETTEEPPTGQLHQTGGQINVTDINQEFRLLYSKSLDILFRQNEQFM